MQCSTDKQTHWSCTTVLLSWTNQSRVGPKSLKRILQTEIDTAHDAGQALSEEVSQHNYYISSHFFFVIEIHIGLFRNWNIVTLKSRPRRGEFFVRFPLSAFPANSQICCPGMRCSLPTGGCHPNALLGLCLSLQLCSGSWTLCNTKGYKKKKATLIPSFLPH